MFNDCEDAGRAGESGDRKRGRVGRESQRIKVNLVRIESGNRGRAGGIIVNQSDQSKTDG
jgi:hypothetical protein